ncbi:hypothetical protein ACH5AO_25065 [Streptomyces sp. NPDC018964]|uniref:hypothetical protein n=1 Tax=unclassified Streptomyces TaxID=2593676 RepID=UPI00379CA77F
MRLLRSRRILPPAAAAAALLTLVTGPQAAADTFPSGRLYTGSGRSGTVMDIDYSDPGVCRALPAPAWSYDVLAENDVDLFFRPGCRTGAPGEDGDLYYRVGTLGTGDFPWAVASYRVRPAGQ